MNKHVITVMTAILITALSGCSQIPAPTVPDVSEKEMIVGSDITEDDINDFYYTIENINYDAYYLRYRFYNEDGKHMFFFEERKRPDDYGPATEEDTTATAGFELSDEEWSKFFDIISGGKIQARKDDPEDGGRGPWTYLYWKGDKDTYQKYSFRSQSSRSAFEELCGSLAEKGSPLKKEENELSRANETAKKAFEEYMENHPGDLVDMIDYYIEDIDGDGYDELLIFQLSKDDMFENLQVIVWEYNNGKTKLTGMYDHGENLLNADEGDTFAFMYEHDGRPAIGILTEDCYYTEADGVDIIFSALSYNGAELQVLGKNEYQGSDLEDTGFTKVMEKCGVPARWDNIVGFDMEDVQYEVLSSCNGRMLAEIITKERGVKLKGYSDNEKGSAKKGKKK